MMAWQTTPPRKDPGVRPIEDLLANLTTREDKPDDLWSIRDLQNWIAHQGIQHPDHALAFLERHVLAADPHSCRSIETTFLRRQVPCVKPARVVEGEQLWQRDWLKAVFLRTYDLDRQAPEGEPTKAQWEGHCARLKAFLSAAFDGVQ